MRKYNIQDLLVLEELYHTIAPFGTGVNFNVFRSGKVSRCNCGGTYKPYKGYATTNAGKYRSYRCEACGHHARGSENLLSKDKRFLLRR
jgi:hypothetical protein